MLFDWYADSDTPSRMSDGFRLGEPSARVFDALAGRVGAVVAGRNTYEDSDHFGGGSPHPTALLFVLSHRPAAEMTERQTLVTTGIEDAVAAVRKAAGDGDVALMGGGVVTEALKAGLVDEVVLHLVPILLGGGQPFVQALPGTCASAWSMPSRARCHPPPPRGPAVTGGLATTARTDPRNHHGTRARRWPRCSTPDPQ